MTDITEALALARRFSGDEDLTVREVAELLWLAGQITPARPPAAAPPDPPPGDSPVPPPGPPAPTPPAEQPPGGPAAAPEPLQPPPAPPTPLHSPDATPADGAGNGGSTPGGRGTPATKAEALPVRRPPALPRRLELARALRPLKRRVRAPGRRILDEPLTADRSARARRPVPALRHASERWLELALVVDDSVSMSVWRRTVDDFRELVEGHGAFRDVRLWRFDADDPALVLRFGTAGEDRADQAAEGRNPAELHDPSGRRLILVLTDGVGALWGTPAMTATVREWARRSPLAVVQMLPPDLWHRTWLPPVRAALRATGPARLTVRPVRPVGPAAPAECATDLAPLVTLDPEWLRPWAQALSGSRTTWRPGSAVDLGREPWHGRPEAAADAAGRLPDHTAGPELVEEFRTWATPGALNLAFLLSAAPLTLPLMRWLQQHLLPATGPAHLAEVFLSDLLVRTTDRHRGEDPDQVVYAFRDGVRDELAAGLTRTRAYQVLTTLIQAPEALAAPFGGSLDFRVLAADPAGPLTLTGGRVFATVAASVLGGLGGELAPYAQAIHAALRGRHPAGGGGAADGTVCVECARVGGRDVVVTTSGSELWLWDVATGHGRLATHRGNLGITALACATTASGRSLAVTLSIDGTLAATDLGAAVAEAPDLRVNVWRHDVRPGRTAHLPVLACHDIMGQRVVAVLGPDGINLLDLDSGATFLPTVPVAERVCALALLTEGGRSQLFTGDTEGVVRGRVLESAEVAVGGPAPAGAPRRAGRLFLLSFGFGAAADPSLEPACHQLARAFEEFRCRTRVAMDVSAREFRRTVEETAALLGDADALVVHVAGQSADSETLFRTLPAEASQGRRLMIVDDCPAVRSAIVPVFGFEAVLMSGPPERAPAWDLTLALAEALRHFAAGRGRRAYDEPFIPFGDVLDLAHRLTDGRTSNTVVLSLRGNDEFLPNPQYVPSLIPFYGQDPAASVETPAFRQLTQWIDDSSAGGLALVTGAPGSGKTTLLDGLALRIRREPGRPTPLAVSATGGDATELARVLAQEISVPGAPVPGTPDDLVARLQHLTIPPVIVVDHLDEARDPEAVVAGLLRPLLESGSCRLVVATRPGRAMAALMRGAQRYTHITLTPFPDLQHRTLRDICDRVLATAPAYRAASADPVREAFCWAVATALIERSPVAEHVLIARAYTGLIASRGDPLEDPEEARWAGSGVPRTSADVVALLLADARNPWTVPVLTTLAAAGDEALTDIEIQRRCGPLSLYEVREALAPVRGLLESVTDSRGRELYRLAASSVAAQIRQAQGIGPACEPPPRRLWSEPVTLGSWRGAVVAMAAAEGFGLFFMGSDNSVLMRTTMVPGQVPVTVPVEELPTQPLPQLRFVDWRGDRALVRSSRKYCTVWPLNVSRRPEFRTPEDLGPIEAFTATTSVGGRPLAVAVNEKGAPRAWHLDDLTPAGERFTAVPRVLGVHGFSHGQHSATALSSQWLLALRDGVERVGHTGPPVPFDVRIAHYGGILRTTGEKTESGNGGNGRGRLRRLADALTRAIGMPNALLPGMGRELYTSLNDPAQRAQARHIVAEAIAARLPDVVIAHSLGGLVAYEALWERPDLSVDLLVTLGAPLGLDLVFNRLEPAPVDGRGRRPPSVRRWVNLAGTDDPLALPHDLTERFEGVSVNIQCAGLGLDTVRTQGYGYLHSVELATVLSQHLGDGDRGRNK